MRRFDSHTEYQVVLGDRSDAHELKPKLPEAVGEWIDCCAQVPLAPATLWA